MTAREKTVPPHCGAVQAGSLPGGPVPYGHAADGPEADGHAAGGTEKGTPAQATPATASPSQDRASSGCRWPGSDHEYRRYHDEEWGVPVTDDRALFEKIVLEGFQAGLSWLTILRKRPHFRRVFDNFDATAIAQYDDIKIAELLTDRGIVRNRAKVEAARDNARAFLALQERAGNRARTHLPAWMRYPAKPGRAGPSPGR